MTQPPPKTIQVNDLPRINQISLVLARNGFGHLLHLLGLGGEPTVDGETPAGNFARRLRQVLVELGPTFVKLGQVLSVRPDILPQEIMAEFESLQDRVPPMPVEDVHWVIEHEMDRPVDQLFREIDPTPLGSASIAQVHRAVLFDGREVAVKLQRRGIERTIRSDISILYALANLAEGRLALPGLHTPRAIIREFDLAISRELDFLQELSNAERLARHLEELDVRVGAPEVYPEWSTRRMLVMELVEGTPLNEVFRSVAPRSPEATRLAHAIMESTYRQAFDFGFFHGDPHPGNLIVTAEGRLVYLDFGVVGTLTGAMQDTIISAFTSMVFRDAETLAMTIYRAGATSGRVDLKAFTGELERKMAQYHGASLDDLANRATFMEIVELCMRFQISLPPEFAVLSRAVTLVEANVRKLLPGVDIVQEVTPYAQRLMSRRFSPERVAHDAARLIFQVQGHFKDLPTQFSQTLMDLEGGNITIVARDPDASLLRDEIRNAVLRLSIAAAASTMTLGSMLFIAAWSPEAYGWPVLGIAGVALAVVGVSLFGALGVHVFFSPMLTFAAWQRFALGVLRFFRWRHHD